MQTCICNRSCPTACPTSKRTRTRASSTTPLRMTACVSQSLLRDGAILLKAALAPCSWRCMAVMVSRSRPRGRSEKLCHTHVCMYVCTHVCIFIWSVYEICMRSGRDAWCCRNQCMGDTLAGRKVRKKHCDGLARCRQIKRTSPGQEDKSTWCGAMHCCIHCVCGSTFVFTFIDLHPTVLMHRWRN